MLYLFSRVRSCKSMKQARRVVWFILSTVVLCALLGGAYGRQVEATTGTDDSDVKASLSAFTRVYDIVEANYADPVDPDQSIYGEPNSPTGAIPSALEPWTRTQISSTRAPLPSSAKTRRVSTTAWACRSGNVPARWASSWSL